MSTLDKPISSGAGSPLPAALFGGVAGATGAYAADRGIPALQYENSNVISPAIGGLLGLIAGAAAKRYTNRRTLENAEALGDPTYRELLEQLAREQGLNQY